MNGQRAEETVSLPQQQVVHHYHGSADSGARSFGKLIDALLPIAVVACVGVVWNLSVTVARMETALKGLTDRVAELREAR